MMKFREIIRNKIFKPYSNRFEERRNGIIHSNIKLHSDSKILDLGGGSGIRMKSLFPHRNVGIYIADISTAQLEIAKKVYGYETIVLDESGKLPFKDGYFDFIFCNSVIEHVTVNKEDIYNITSNKIFKQKSFLHQRLFAEEIKRVGKSYFVQTPYKYFLIESHLWFPSIYLFFPRKIQIKLIQFLNKFWVKTSSPDFSLLTIKDFSSLFSEAKIVKEKSFFITKSLIAIKSNS